MKNDFTMQLAAVARLPVFLAVAERRSFTAAAKALRISTSATSQTIARLEAELGLALFLRTTRSVKLTDAGARLLASVAPAISTVYSALADAAQVRERPSGVLRLNVPRVACCLGLNAILADYARKYPEVRVEVVVDDRNVDILREGFDAGVRARESIDRDMICRRLSAPIRFVVVGSKRYFARHGRPKHPRDLIHHRCLGWRSLKSATEYRWEFSDRGNDLEVAVTGPILSNDSELLLECARQDLGLSYVTEGEAQADVASGELEVVLARYAVEDPGLFLYFPRAAAREQKLSAFLGCVQARLLSSPQLRSGIGTTGSSTRGSSNS